MESINALIWGQFGATIDMLENAIVACPPELWNNGSRFWYLAYHSIWWTNYYLSDDTPIEADFQPPAPFTKSEFIDELMPERVYDKEELLNFLQQTREKCRAAMRRLSVDDLLTKRFVSEWKDFNLFELQLYNMRHVQHHTAQLNMLLRQAGAIQVPDWVSKTKIPL